MKCSFCHLALLPFQILVFIVTFFYVSVKLCFRSDKKMEEKQILQLSAGFASRTEHETKALHFRIIRFMFEAGI